MIPATPESVSLALDTIARLEVLIAAEYETAEGQRALSADVADWYGIAPRLTVLVQTHGSALGWLGVALERGETASAFDETMRRCALRHTYADLLQLLGDCPTRLGVLRG